MKTEETTDFIIIDDDFINNVICQQVIQNELQGTKIDIYTNAVKGLEHISAAYSDTNSNNAILFLDVNMPVLNGWDILEVLNGLAPRLRQHLKVFMLTSSVTPDDKQKATADPMVLGYIEKPLTQGKLREILHR